MLLSGAEIVLECLKEYGVDTLFGYPGGAVIPLYNALYDQLEVFNHIRTAHEQGAVHAADGYARSTGKVGVCIATSGPGATNTVTGIATAYMDSTPMVIITGQVSSPLLGKDSFQEIDITGLTVSITKHSYLVKNINNLANTIRKAFNLSTSGRQGPVLIDITKDVLMAKSEYQSPKKEVNENPYQSFDLESLAKIGRLINSSKRPVIYAGGGIKSADASEELMKLAKKSNIPVVNTLMGLGTISRNNELSLGLVGMHGSIETNLCVTHSDLLIAVGARFSDRVIGTNSNFAAKAKIIHIDIDESEFGKNIQPHATLLGHLKSNIHKLLEHVDEKDRSEWWNEIRSYADTHFDKSNGFNPKNILNSINERLPQNCYVVTDVGQHQMWTAQHWKFNHVRSFITSGGLGTMGFGLGAAIGTKEGNPDSSVVLVTGDGSFRMNCNELSTVSKYKIPIVIVLFNNQTLGMVRQWQRMFSNARYCETDITEDVDYIKLVDAYGIQGYKVDNIEALNEVLGKAKINQKPIFIQCDINKDESVYPIVPPGASIDEMLIDG